MSPLDFFKKNRYYVLLMILIMGVGIVTETLNMAFDVYQDGSYTGYWFSLIIALILLVSYVADRNVNK